MPIPAHHPLRKCLRELLECQAHQLLRFPILTLPPALSQLLHEIENQRVSSIVEYHYPQVQELSILLYYSKLPVSELLSALKIPIYH